MKHLGVCSALIACCLAAPAWAVRFGEPEPADGAAPVTQQAGPVEVVPEDTYMPWQVYGYGSPYDQSAIAGYNAWPQVCTDGLWDNFCNEQHCHCYKGPKHHCGNQFGGCNSCGGRHHHKEFTPVHSVRGNCANGNCGATVSGPSYEMQSAPEPSLQPQPVPEPALQPQAVPEPPTEDQNSARMFPRTNPVRQQFLMPANWRGVK
jgi:hypothetical protein